MFELFYFVKYILGEEIPTENIKKCGFLIFLIDKNFLSFVDDPQIRKLIL